MIKVRESPRFCTDILFLILFIASFVFLFVIYGMATDRGADIDKTVRGVDFQLRVCGKDEGVKDKPYLGE